MFVELKFYFSKNTSALKPSLHSKAITVSFLFDEITLAFLLSTVSISEI
ncbi:hypothetical protein JCM19274_2748 [Algibacter lectus]|uniref:Uncharacterized protein n=1 Tax=Algibacter lectus TaxID=221126 RepID=A0A090X6X4_9FLAO|nr:hypothetical protein JCM19274_2748 [Algibacter lectus]